MNNVIYYFSGSGNSLKVAKDLANEMGGTELVSIAKVVNQDIEISYDCIGLVFPVYAWGVPRIVQRFAQKLKADRYVFTVLTYGSSPGNTMEQINEILKSNGTKLSAGFGIAMPDSYIPMFSPNSEEEQKKMFQSELEKVKFIAEIINQKQEYPLEKKNTGFNWFFSGIIYPNAMKKFTTLDKKFWTNDKCNNCGICEKICPVNNIDIEKGKPKWLHNCEACMACIQWCPTQSIQYGKKTEKRKRYRHPEINVQEMIIK
ncbi:EFR1 family ferrodoxin [Brassicibacter mesophilus]|uniref:EFR1 family ferrodoxin n=1 Tax=Brassicibacter mesophilus TaxID=745119 RepID=UPI003D24B810